jgi:hypothetical protein
MRIAASYQMIVRVRNWLCFRSWGFTDSLPRIDAVLRYATYAWYRIQ